VVLFVNERKYSYSHECLEEGPVLGHLQHYPFDICQHPLFCQLTEQGARGWIAFLRTTASINDIARSPVTVATYARSAHAFCHWLVRKGYLESTPFDKGSLPKVGKIPLQLIEPDDFGRLLLACRVGGEHNEAGERAAVRNRAILWFFLDTGMRVSELCELRLADVNEEQQAVRLPRAGGREHWVTLSSNAWFQLRSYLEHARPKGIGVKDRGEVEENHLFLSEWYQPLSSNRITLLFHHLKKRAGISGKPLSPSGLRDTCAVRYLQAGGTRQALGGSWG